MFMKTRFIYATQKFKVIIIYIFSVVEIIIRLQRTFCSDNKKDKYVKIYDFKITFISSKMTGASRSQTIES